MYDSQRTIVNVQKPMSKSQCRLSNVECLMSISESNIGIESPATASRIHGKAAANDQEQGTRTFDLQPTRLTARTTLLHNSEGYQRQ